MFKWIENVFGTDTNEKVIKRLAVVVEKVNSFESSIEKLSDEQLRAKTIEFRERLKNGEKLDDILPEAFACIRESARRNIEQRHFDMQLMGGMVLHQGKIAEMKTGEGKTLVATLPLYLNSIEGKGSHLVTVNDYLAKRDAQWMGAIYHALGVSVASIQHEAAFLYDPAYVIENMSYNHLRPISRKEAYLADITYGTNNEFGFDYLRDNMVLDSSQKAQRKFNYAIVDEVDNILIDEARTPLIISAPAEESTDKYIKFARLVPRLKVAEDYTVDEKTRTVSITETGISKLEKWLGLTNIYAPENFGLTRYLENALKASIIFKIDRDYVVKDGEVVIVDEFTGRLMFGRRYSDGLHQAIEAKESVKIQRESMTLATITLQNYFRLYPKLAGMTGTAVTEAEEFHKIYKLEVVTMPTNKPMVRDDLTDQIYKNEEAKFNAVAREIVELHKENRPVLVGTVSIEKSEYLSDILDRKGVPHQVLNAKHHEKEAAIVAQAGRPGAVTIATNMAGRGVDIMLGGNPSGLGMTPEEWGKEHLKVVEAGGLHIIGTERHESRRIDNQLRGRSGRQGDPGSSRFFLSLEDDVMRRFGGERMKSIMNWAGIKDDVPIENALINRAVNSSQTKVEGYNFDIRKHLLDYDDVVNKQREIIYSERNKILEGSDLKVNICNMMKSEMANHINVHLGNKDSEEWDIDGLLNDIKTIIPVTDDINKDSLAKLSRKELEQKLMENIDSAYTKREQEIGADDMRKIERVVMLRTIDRHWIQYLTEMEHLREGIGLEAYGQRDPLMVYKKEALAMFQNLQTAIQTDITHLIMNVNIVKQQASTPQRKLSTNKEDGHKEPAKSTLKIGRNDLCPCGSGKKYKYCCGKS